MRTCKIMLPHTVCVDVDLVNLSHSNIMQVLPSNGD